MQLMKNIILYRSAIKYSLVRTIYENTCEVMPECHRERRNLAIFVPSSSTPISSW